MNKLQTISNDAIGLRTEIARSGSKTTETRSDAYGSEVVHFSRANGVAAHYEYARFVDRMWRVARFPGVNFFTASYSTTFTPPLGRGQGPDPIEYGAVMMEAVKNTMFAGLIMVNMVLCQGCWNAGPSQQGISDVPVLYEQKNFVCPYRLIQNSPYNHWLNPA